MIAAFLGEIVVSLVFDGTVETLRHVPTAPRVGSPWTVGGFVLAVIVILGGAWATVASGEISWAIAAVVLFISGRTLGLTRGLWSER